MADSVRRVNYCYMVVPDRAGQGAKVLGELQDAGVNLLAYSGFPVQGGKAQLNFVAENLPVLRRAARKKGWTLSTTKRGFLIRGQDKLGAVHRFIQRLADEKINVTAAEAICAGKGRYGMILWVKPRAYARAAKVLGAK